MKKITFLLVMLLWIGAVSAQKTITGTVTDANDGSTIPGVSVMVKGQSTVGTVTKPSGQYSLDVPADAEVLVFSFVGKTNTEVVIGDQTVINVALEDETVGLDEVIVVAYGVQRREATTGSVGVVKGDEIEDAPVESMEKMLHGKVAGVQINSTTGQPGSSTQIRIRGFSSINAGQEPLYVIDGVPVSTGNYSYFNSTGNIMSSINPDDIASISILKDASAAAIYGSRAANGVILITTKSGKDGKPKFKLKLNYGVSNVDLDNDNFRMMNAEEIYGYNREAIVNSGLDPATYDPPGGTEGSGFYSSETLPSDVETFDWLDAAFRTAINQNFQFSVNGGGETSKYYTSVDYYKEEGVMIATSLERYSFRNNLDRKINDKFSVGTRVHGSYTVQQDRPNERLYYVNPFWAGVSLLPWHLPYLDTDGNPTTEQVEGGTYNFTLPSNSNANFLAAAEHNDQWEKAYRMIGSVYGVYEPIKGLRIKSQNSIDMNYGEGRRYWSPLGGLNEDGTLQVSNTLARRLTTTNTVNYQNTFASLHNVSVLAGQEAMWYKYFEHYGSGEGVGSVIPYLSNTTQEASTVGYGFTEYALMSFFGQVEYSFNEKYNAKFSARSDGSSRFGENNVWGFFYSASASWNIHKESFMSALDFVDMAKLRVSYGVSGNDQIGDYTHYGTYGTGDYNSVTYMSPSGLANPDLTWEPNTSLNVGLDFAVIKNLQGTFEYFERYTNDMLLAVPISRTTGFTSHTLNTGSMYNKGFEAMLKYTMRFGDVLWQINGNISSVKTRITDMAGLGEIADGFWRRYREDGEGYSEYYVYDYAGVNPANGMAMWWTEDRESVSQNYSDAQRVFSGKVEPDFFGGFGTNVSWKGLSLSASFEYKAGQKFYAMESRYTVSDGYNWGTNQSAALLDHWTEPGQIAENPKPLVVNSSNSNAWGTSRFLVDGDYVRFKNLTVSYNLPKQWAQMAQLSGVRVYISANNLYTWHDVPYWDPERNVTGGGYIIYPQTRAVMFGLDIEL